MMDKQQFLDGVKRAIVVLKVEDADHFAEIFTNIVAFAVGGIDKESPLDSIDDLGVHMADLFEEDMTLEELYNQLTEGQDAE